MALLLAYIGAADFFRASRKLLWFDEITTVVIAQQQSPSKIWATLAHATDSNPPPFYMLESAVQKLFPDPHLGYRAASVVAFLVVPLALFVFMRRISGTLSGLIAAVIPLVTDLHPHFAIEARPYALESACIALALLFWQRPERRGAAVGLACFLTLASALHYYAVFVLVPLGLGEAIRSIRLKKLRLDMWAALLCAMLPLVAFSPLLLASKRAVGAGFWAQATVFRIAESYDSLLKLPVGWGTGVAFAIVIGLLVTLFQPSKKGLPDDAARITPEECAVIGGLIGLPFIVYTAAKLAHGGMAERYSIALILGVTLGAAYLGSRLGPFATRCLLAILLLVLSIQEVHDWATVYKTPRAASGAPNLAQEMKTLHPDPALPVVVSDGLRFLQLMYYAPDSHLIFLTDRAQALTYAGSDSLDLVVPITSRYMPLDVRAFDGFRQKNPRFLLLSTREARWDWWPQRLKDDGYSLQPIGILPSGILYLAEAPGTRQ